MYYWFHQSFYMAKAFPFIGGWLADRLLGDPEGWPHPVVGFGKVISLGEKTLNKGNDRTVKGGVMALILVAGTYLLCERILALDLKLRKSMQIELKEIQQNSQKTFIYVTQDRKSVV